MSREKETVAILGAGLMGHGIAQVFAEAGHPVRVFDAQTSALESLRERVRRNLADLGRPPGAEARIEGFAELRQAVAGAALVIEAAPEDLALKRRLFADLVRLAPADAMLASNTSVLPISAIAEGLETRGRILGAHWWNPPFLVPLVEVIGTPETDPLVLNRVIDWLKAVGKTPVHVKRDVPGFVGNRLQHALWREAVAIVAEGIADAETVDAVVKASFGRRLGVLGPLENADLVGTDLTRAIHATVLPALDRSTEPSPYLTGLVEAGRLGVKTGEGFRRWTPEAVAALRARVFEHLKDWSRRDAGSGSTD